LTSHKDHKTTQQLRHFISLFSQDYTRITKCSQDFISRCHSADIDSLSPISNSKKALFLFCCFLADCSFMLTRGIKTHRSGCTGCTIHDLRSNYSERDFKKIADYNHISKKKDQSPAKVAGKQGATHSAQFPNPIIKKRKEKQLSYLRAALPGWPSPAPSWEVGLLRSPPHFGGPAWLRQWEAAPQCASDDRSQAGGPLCQRHPWWPRTQASRPAARSAPAGDRRPEQI